MELSKQSRGPFQSFFLLGIFLSACADLNQSNNAQPTALFATVASTKPILTVENNGTGVGTVNGSGINCGSDCTEQFNNPATVVLSPTAASGSTFAGWTGACSGLGACSIVMNSNKLVIATFNLVTSGGGSDHLPQPNAVVGYWKMDEPSWSGTQRDVIDSSNFGNNHAQSFGGAQTEPGGKIDRGGKFNGTDDVVKVPNPIINTSAGYTIATWVKLPVTNTWKTLISQDGNNMSAFYLMIEGGNRFAFRVSNGDYLPASVQFTYATHSLNIVPNTWYHVVGVHDANAQKIKLFVNNIKTESNYTTPWASDGDFIIGAAKWNQAPVDFITGSLDETVAWSVALSDSEVAALWQVYQTGGADSEPPSIPTNLSASTLTPTSVTLTWTASTDNVGVTEYRIFRNGQQIGTSSVPTFINSPITPLTTYSYTVAAADAAGNISGQSIPLQVTTPANTVGLTFSPNSTNLGTIVNPQFSNVSSTVVGDFNGDGIDDVAVFEGGKHSCGANCRILAWLKAPNPSIPGSVWTRYNFDSDYSIQENRDFYGSAAGGDVDGDGDIDVVYSEDRHSGGFPNNFNGKIIWYENPRLNNPDPNSFSLEGRWKAHTVWYFNQQNENGVEHMNDMAISDIDGNGKLDILVRHLNNNVSRLKVLFQVGNDSWELMNIGPPITGRGEGLCVGDLSGDLKPDIALSGYWLYSASLAPPDRRNPANWTRYNIDADFYGQDLGQQANNAVKCAIGDLDADGKQDIGFATAEDGPEASYTKIAVYKNPGSPMTQNWITFPPLASFISFSHTIRFADFDGDGRLDIMTGQAFGHNQIRIYRQNSDFSFDAYYQVTGDHGLYSGVVGDFDGDGDIDIVGPRDYRGELRFYKNLRFP